MATLVLGRGFKTTVDDSDLDQLSKYKWGAFKSRKHTYAVASQKHVCIYLHRLLLKAKRGQIVDHINGDTLDNRRANLRFATQAQNIANQKPKGRKFKGVYGNGPYTAMIRVMGTLIYLGSFENEKTAAIAYDRAARQYFGEFARLNLPGGNVDA